jgi:hypothetical protein
MRFEETTSKLILEMQQKAHLSLLQFDLIKRYVRYAFAVGFDEGRRNKIHRKPIVQLLNGNIIREYSSATDAARANGLSKVTVFKSTRGLKIDKNYEFRYVKRKLN